MYLFLFFFFNGYQLKTFSDTDRQEVTTVEVEKMLKNLQEHYVKFGSKNVLSLSM